MVYQTYKGGQESSLDHKSHGSMPFLRIPRSPSRPVSPPGLWIASNDEVMAMFKKKILKPERVRCIDGGFSFIPHRFLGQGFLASLHQKELLLYLFLILAADRHGLSFYSYDKICTLLEFSLEEYIVSRDSLIEKDLIAFGSTIFQVLSLPQKKSDQIKREVYSSVGELIQQTAKSLDYDR
jgi:hypothetical protein